MNALANILLVEDNPDDFEATSRSLQRNHFVNPVRWCRTGRDAIDYLRHGGVYAGDAKVLRPDLILLDLNMPGIDGRKVLEIIKSDDDLKSIPVVVLTTSRDSKDVDQCYAIGANTYIQKPVSFEGLTQAIGAMKDYWFGIAILPRTE
ncbi:MAG: response regulator [Alphaproteobacteria bacterium]|nr:response regulator [Alphaproteobacteria bacterium]